jgi:hypothetical protein
MYLSQNGVEHVEVGVQVNAVGSLKYLRLVTLTLLVEHIQLHAQVRL